MKYKLSEIGKVVGGGTPSTKHPEYYTGSGIPWLTPKDLSGYDKMYISKGGRDITQEGLENSSAKLLPANSVLVSSRAPIGYVAIAENEIATNQGFKSIIPNRELVIPEYLYFVMKTSKQDLEQIASGSTFKEVSTKVMSNFEVEIPDLDEQRKVLDYLLPITRKIEKNSGINDNLLELLDTEFSHRFINNSDYSTGKISDFVSIKRGASPRPIKDYLSDKGRAWIKISDVTKLTSPFLYGTGQFIKETGIDKSRTIKPGTLILSNSATPGIPIISEILASVHDGWLIINNYKYMDRNWFYLFFRQMRRQLVSRANGSVFNNLKTSIVKNFPVPIATEEELSDFKKFADPIFDKLNQLQQESIALGKLKDSLLKKYF